MAINIFAGTEGNVLFTGLAADTKPSSPAAGWAFLEIDTGKTYKVSGGAWVVNPVPTLTLADDTTNNASTSMHGFLKKLSNTATDNPVMSARV